MKIHRLFFIFLLLITPTVYSCGFAGNGLLWKCIGVIVKIHDFFENFSSDYECEKSNCSEEMEDELKSEKE